MQLVVTVNAQFFQQSVVESYKSITKYEYGRDFSKRMSSSKGSAEVQASYKLFSGSVKGAWDLVSQSTEENEHASFSKEEQKTRYNDGFLQLIREVTTTITFDGASATVVETKFVDSIPAKQPKSSQELVHHAAEWIRDHCSGNHWIKTSEVDATLAVTVSSPQLVLYQAKVLLASEKFPGHYLDCGPTDGRAHGRSTNRTWDWCHWKIHPCQDEVVIESCKFPGHFLDAGGAGYVHVNNTDSKSDWVRWKVRPVGNGMVAFESVRRPGAYLDVGHGDDKSGYSHATNSNYTHSWVHWKVIPYS